MLSDNAPSGFGRVQEALESAAFGQHVFPTVFLHPCLSSLPNFFFNIAPHRRCDDDICHCIEATQTSERVENFQARPADSVVKDAVQVDDGPDFEVRFMAIFQ